MLSITTNLSSLITQSSLTKSTNGLNQAIERMSTGFKINGAKDNAANYSIATNLSSKISSYQVAEDNATMGLDMVNTASASLSEIEGKLTRLRALQEQASNGTYGEKSLQAINAEVNALVDEIERLYNTTEYNGIEVFKDKSKLVAGTDGFISAVEKQTPDVVVSDPTELANAIANHSVIGISNAETLAQLATLVNTGVTTCSGKTIVLTNDIDLEEWCAEHTEADGTGGWTPIGMGGVSFQGVFNGNGYEISNLYINRSEDYQGLFGYIKNAKIKNLGLADVNITGKIKVAPLVGYAEYATITNCYSTGNVNGNGANIGGLIGSAMYEFGIVDCYSSTNVKGEESNSVGGLIGGVGGGGGVKNVNNCYSTGDVIGKEYVGGLVGTCQASVTNCYSTSNVTGTTGGRLTGGLIGLMYAQTTNCYSTGNVAGYREVGGLIGWTENSIVDSYTTSKIDGNKSSTAALVYTFYNPSYTITNSKYYSSINGNMSAVGDNRGGIDLSGVVDGVVPSASKGLELQVGINGNESSQINCDIGFELENIKQLRKIGLSNKKYYLSIIDGYLSTISAKQTEYGAAQNRLESALMEIATQYENLVSSRSTIKDADMAKESSQYIRMQILQEASATLMATANQTPAIALQLI